MWSCRRTIPTMGLSIHPYLYDISQLQMPKILLKSRAGGGCFPPQTGSTPAICVPSDTTAIEGDVQNTYRQGKDHIDSSNMAWYSYLLQMAVCSPYTFLLWLPLLSQDTGRDHHPNLEKLPEGVAPTWFHHDKLPYLE